MKDPPIIGISSQLEHLPIYFQDSRRDSVSRVLASQEGNRTFSSPLRIARQPPWNFINGYCQSGVNRARDNWRQGSEVNPHAERFRSLTSPTFQDTNQSDPTEPVFSDAPMIPTARTMPTGESRWRCSGHTGHVSTTGVTPIWLLRWMQAC